MNKRASDSEAKWKPCASFALTNAVDPDGYPAMRPAARGVGEGGCGQGGTDVGPQTA